MNGFSTLHVVRILFTVLIFLSLDGLYPVKAVGRHCPKYEFHAACRCPAQKL
jgi:hypothetical protein